MPILEMKKCRLLSTQEHLVEQHTPGAVNTRGCPLTHYRGNCRAVLSGEIVILKGAQVPLFTVTMVTLIIPLLMLTLRRVQHEAPCVPRTPGGGVFSPLRDEGLVLREVECLAWGHTAGTKWGQDLD